MSELKKLRISRRVHRGQATKLCTKADDIIGQSEQSDVKQIQSIVSTTETLTKKIELLKDLDDKIVNLLDIEEEIAMEITEAYDLQTDLYEKRDQFRQFTIPTLSTSILRANAPAFNPPSLVNLSSTSSTHNANRLPKLNLPTFSGDLLTWQTFWDSFDVTVHSNPNLSDVQKFSYLKSQLQGVAARAVDGFPLTNANYKHSIDILADRFGQPHKIVNVHMQSLLELSPPSTSLPSLRQFYDSMESHVRGLESLGKFQESYGDLLIPIILGKLPSDMKKNLAREHSSSEWSIIELRQAIKKEIEILEAGSYNNASSFSSLDQDIRPTTASFLTHTDNKNTRRPSNTTSSSTAAGNTFKKKSCVFCSDSHSHSDCQIVRDTGARLDIIRQKKLCFNCFGTHLSSQCRSKYRCRVCSKKHHTSLHKPRSEHDSDENIVTNRKPDTFPEPTTKAVYMASSPEITDSVYHTGKLEAKNILLKTAIAPVCCDGMYTEANILFDEGAQRSFITQKLADELQLVPMSTENISLSHFGAKATSTRQLDVTTVYVETEDKKKIPVCTLVVPTIGMPLSKWGMAYHIHITYKD